ncbi:hypothetical protein QJS10_CPA07g00582 [Acorus calamus]|uniref:Uncharacterized protein n=1 Tax=Acorus calamus TaxID=4465 RepID=A0AAV9EF24_ACOCL|nr:hypothetical protein QJS10_CPA07g00582 [Acorus calamus]
MASSAPIMSFRPTGFRAQAASGNPRSESRRPGGGQWWAPLFGWPSEPDYNYGGGGDASSPPQPTEEEAEKAMRRRFGRFTEEKAKKLRMRTMETATFHDVMYHSAIASRLASDVPDRSGGGR